MTTRASLSRPSRRCAVSGRVRWPRCKASPNGRSVSSCGILAYPSRAVLPPPPIRPARLRFHKRLRRRPSARIATDRLPEALAARTGLTRDLPVSSGAASVTVQPNVRAYRARMAAPQPPADGGPGAAGRKPGSHPQATCWAERDTAQRTSDSRCTLHRPIPGKPGWQPPAGSLCMWKSPGLPLAPAGPGSPLSKGPPYGAAFR